MNRRTQRCEPASNNQVADLQFEAWPATGFVPNRYCFLYAFFTQCLEKNKDGAGFDEVPERWVTWVH